MEAESVLKAAFPGGSSGSLAASAAGREAMPGTGTGDWDRDLHHLESLVNDGLRILELDGSEAVDEDDRDSRPEPPEEDEDEEGVSAGRTSPAPLLVPARKPGSHRRGPPRGRNKPTGVKKSLEKSRQLDQTLSDLERRREMEAESVLKAAFPGGSSGSLAASAAGREAMPGTGTGEMELAQQCPGCTTSKAHTAPALAELHVREQPWMPTVRAGRSQARRCCDQWRGPEGLGEPTLRVPGCGHVSFSGIIGAWTP
ncbi:uncharacterized protein ACIQIH_012539 [Cyanocitta cristata]